MPVRFDGACDHGVLRVIRLCRVVHSIPLVEVVMFRRVPVKLHDCLEPGRGNGSELIIVEGDSASKAAARSRNRLLQAVLPMQGKPLNAWKASRSVVERNELFGALVDALGVGFAENVDPTQSRYDQVTLLFDPDADGIHCGALTLMFFFRWMRPMLDSGMIGLVRPPIIEIRSPDGSEVIHAYNREHYQTLRAALNEKGVRYQIQRYRGLASMGEEVLAETCLNRETRQRVVCTPEDAEAAIRVFSGG